MYNYKKDIVLAVDNYTLAHSEMLQRVKKWSLILMMLMLQDASQFFIADRYTVFSVSIATSVK